MYNRAEVPEVLLNFLVYHETIRGHSPKTIDEYYLDLRTFFRFLKVERGLVSADVPMNEIPITDVDLDFVKSVTLAEVYAFLSYLSHDRVRSQTSRSPEYGLNAASRSRKIATIRSFYKYLTAKAKLLEVNPVLDLDSPKRQRALPRYLSVDESKSLLMAVDGKNAARDYCIICIFLNCGLRISEIVGLNLTSIHTDRMTVLGKGNKERTVFLNDATAAAINAYLAERREMNAIDRNALFLSNRMTRISKEAIHAMLKKTFLKAGIDPEKYSAHKLRHTAATMMLQNGVDVRTLQELLGHDNLNTTQIYTHVDNTELRIAASANPLAEFGVKPQKRAKKED